MLRSHPVPPRTTSLSNQESPRWRLAETASRLRHRDPRARSSWPWRPERGEGARRSQPSRAGEFEAPLRKAATAGRRRSEPRRTSRRKGRGPRRAGSGGRFRAARPRRPDPGVGEECGIEAVRLPACAAEDEQVGSCSDDRSPGDKLVGVERWDPDPGARRRVEDPAAVAEVVAAGLGEHAAPEVLLAVGRVGKRRPLTARRLEDAAVRISAAPVVGLAAVGAAERGVDQTSVVQHPGAGGEDLGVGQPSPRAGLEVDGGSTRDGRLLGAGVGDELARGPVPVRSASAARRSRPGRPECGKRRTGGNTPGGSRSVFAALEQGAQP